MSQVSVNAAPLQLPSGADSVIVQVSASPPINGAVAVVLDTSDSCSLDRGILNHATKLIGVLPRRWPLWLYRVSSEAPLIPLDRHRVEDLHEDRLNFDGYLDRSEVLSQGSQCGSFVRPTLEAVEKARTAAGVDEILVLLLTDGELFDVAPYRVSKRMELAGLTNRVDASKIKQWRRVLPTTTLHTPADQKLDQLFAAKNSPYWGLCEIEWELGSNSSVHPQLFDATSKSFHKLSDSKLESNLSLNSPLMQFEMSVDEFTPIRWACRSLQSRESTPLQVSFVDQVISQDFLDSIDSSRESPLGAASHILLAADSASEGFEVLWEDAKRAARLAEQSSRWLDDQGAMVLFRGLPLQDEQGKSKYHALLCLTRGDLQSSASSDSQVLLIALDRAARPAFSWTPNLPMGDIQALNNTELFFDAQRARWFVRYDDRKPEELDPYGSQMLSFVQLTDSNWTVIFSGNLR